MNYNADIIFCLDNYYDRTEVFFYLKDKFNLGHLGNVKSLLVEHGIQFPQYLNEKRPRAFTIEPKRRAELQELSLSGVDMTVYKKKKAAIHPPSN